MFSFNRILLPLVVSHLLPFSLGNAIPQNLENRFATNSEYNGTSISDGLQLSSRDWTLKDFPGLDVLLKNDQLCANRKNWHRSVDLQKRARISDILWRTGQAIVVNMGLAAYHAWNQAPDTIGTWGLCGCTAVVIASEGGAIVAHIQPNPALFNVQLNRIRDLFNQNVRGGTLPRLFLITPVLDNVPQVPPWQDQISNYLNSLGASIQHEYYPMVINGGPRDGTVVVQRIAGALKVWLNEKLISSSG